jgi:GH24 family phage-related lysozyme (muramidase)
MKFLILIAILMAALARPLPAQSPSSPGSGKPPSQSTQEKKDQKTQAKAEKAASKTRAAAKEKKTTSSQDAAYALAYKAGIPKV